MCLSIKLAEMVQAEAEAYFPKKSPNDFSNWFTKVADCGIAVPKTFFTSTPMPDTEPEFAMDLQRAWYMDNPAESMKVIQSWLDRDVIPRLKELNLRGHIFVKNGTFSNKFDAKGTCSLYGDYELARAIANINYAALCLGAGGTTEIVVRQYIEYDREKIPCIYNGLPLRPEFRVFYDFDEKKTIFTENYWNYGYVAPKLRDRTDQIVFDYEQARLKAAFAKHRDEVQEMVSSAMGNVSGFTGQWSVDILLDETGQFWLIDMARAQDSTYWDKRPGNPEGNP